MTATALFLLVGLIWRGWLTSRQRRSSTPATFAAADVVRVWRRR